MAHSRREIGKSRFLARSRPNRLFQSTGGGWGRLKSSRRMHAMSGTTISIRSRDGGKFHCYLVTPKTDNPVPAVVLASAVHGVDADIRAIADEFAAHGFIAAAPDLFWRSVPGPLSRGDDRAVQRSQPRLEKINAGEGDMADTLAHLSTLLKFNGRAVAMGFCYGGP